MHQFSYSICVLALLIFSCTPSYDQGTHHKSKHAHSHDDHAHGHANHHMHETPFEELVERFESAERSVYQKPDSVLQYLGDLKGLKAMDIGAGTGYFSFRMAAAGASVIAADVDEKFQQYVKDKKEQMGLSEEQLSLRKIPYDGPGLQAAEVDLVLIVNTYHHIEDRIVYFKKVKEGLKEGGRLVIIDFFKKDSPVGPPVEMKISRGQVQKELSTAGFTTFEIEEQLLPYQYILTAQF